MISLVLFVVILIVGADVDKNQQIINLAITTAAAEIMPGFNFTLDGPLSQYHASVENSCSATSVQRVACCQPLDVRYLHNVRVANGAFEVERKLNSRVVAQSGTRKLRQHGSIEPLPDIVSTVMREKHLFRVNLAEVSGTIGPSTCKSYFNGTLHVNGRTTAHNVYHAGTLNSIVLPKLLIYIFLS